MTKKIITGIRKLKKGNREYFFGQAQSNYIKEIIRVPTIEKSVKTYLLEDSKDGYQRSAQISRMSKFKTFLNTYPDQIVPPILLSDRGRWEFVLDNHSDNEFGEFHINLPAFVIDGQHRLGGYVAHYEEFDESVGIDFILIKDLNREEEIKEFTTINGTAVGVPKQLNTWLSVQMDDGATKFDFAAVSAMQEDQSVFLGKIQGHSTKKKEFYKLNSISSCIKHMFRHSVFDDMEVEQLYKTWNQFWWLVRITHQDIWNVDIERESVQKMDNKLLELTGLIAYSQAADDMLTRSYNQEKDEFNWDEVEKCLEFLSDFDWRKNGEFEGRTGSAGGSVISRELKRDILAFYSSNN